MREAREVIASYLAIDVYGEGVLDFVDVFKDADAILTALSSAGIDCEGWRDIESAPKDGTPILGYCVTPRLHGKPKLFGVTWWAPALSERKTWLLFDGEYGGDKFGPFWSWTPTHWRPLPLPPLASGGG